MSLPIDIAIIDELEKIGTDWVIERVSTTTAPFYSFGSSPNLEYEVRLTNGRLYADGRGITVGQAISSAVISVMQSADEVWNRIAK